MASSTAARDCVEDNAAHINTVQNIFLPQHLEYVPANGLAFAVRVGCQNEPVG